MRGYETPVEPGGNTLVIPVFEGDISGPMPSSEMQVSGEPQKRSLIVLPEPDKGKLGAEDNQRLVNPPIKTCSFVVLLIRRSPKWLT